MNVIIFSLTILCIYAIMRRGYSAWKNADLREKMQEIEDIEERYDNVKKFKKVHKGDINEKKETVDKFIKE